MRKHTTSWAALALASAALFIALGGPAWAGGLINGSRVALTGQGVAPSLFAVMAALGKDRVVGRLKAAGEIVMVAEGLS